VGSRGRLPHRPTEVSLDEDSDLSYIVGLVRQAFEHQIDSD
jgi:predicted transport protein